MKNLRYEKLNAGMKNKEKSSDYKEVRELHRLENYSKMKSKDKLSIPKQRIEKCLTLLVWKKM